LFSKHRKSTTGNILGVIWAKLDHCNVLSMLGVFLYSSRICFVSLWMEKPRELSAKQPFGSTLLLLGQVHYIPIKFFSPEPTDDGCHYGTGLLTCSKKEVTGDDTFIDYAQHGDIDIPVMGLAIVGKTTFIHTLLGRDTTTVYHYMER